MQVLVRHYVKKSLIHKEVKIIRKKEIKLENLLKKCPLMNTITCNLRTCFGVELHGSVSKLTFPTNDYSK